MYNVRACTLTYNYLMLLKTTTNGAASQKSIEIHLKLDNYQLNRIFFDTSGLSATWPEFWAIGLSFFRAFVFLDGLLAHSAGGAWFTKCNIYMVMRTGVRIIQLSG